MNSENFCYWLKGFFELENPKNLNEQQVEMIKDHLNLVFKKITPERTISFLDPKEKIEKEFLCMTC